jgi:hypothetical protein
MDSNPDAPSGNARLATAAMASSTVARCLGWVRSLESAMTLAALEARDDPASYGARSSPCRRPRRYVRPRSMSAAKPASSPALTTERSRSTAYRSAVSDSVP